MRIIPLIIASLAMAQSAHAKQFYDVKITHPYFESIEDLRLQEVVIGNPDGSFEPDTSINRVEFTKIVVAALYEDDFIKRCLQTAGEQGDYENYKEPIDSFEELKDLTEDYPENDIEIEKFIDADYKDWYGPYLCIAQKNEIIAGYADGTFKPLQRVNFAEAATILSRAFDIMKPTNHSDTELLWYKPYVDDLSDINAIPATIGGFDYYITRGEMAEMIVRLQKYKNNRYKTSKAHLTFEDMTRSGSWVHYEDKELGFSLEYPDDWEDPYLVDREVYDEYHPKVASMWRLYLGPEFDCEGFGTCVERVYSLDGFDRDEVDTYIQSINYDRATTAISDRIINGSRVILYEEQGKCNTRAALILGAKYLYVFRAQCGGDIPTQARTLQTLVDRFTAIYPKPVR